MKHLIFGMFFMLSAGLLTAQDDSNYVMFETMYITPDNAKLNAFFEGLQNHNNSYHNEGPFMTNIYRVTSGPNVDKYSWVMGPCKFSDFDNRGGKEHGDDWIENVQQFTKKSEHGEYWRMNTELSTVKPLGPDRPPYKILFLRYSKFNRGQSGLADEFYKKISAVMKELDRPWGLFYNEFRQGNIGRHVASISYYNNWKEFDEDLKFKETYEKLYGSDSWEQLMQQVQTLFEDTYDEIWEHAPGLSGGQ